MRVHANQDGLKLNGSHQFLVCSDGVDVFEGSVHTIKETAEALIVVSKGIGLEVNVDKTTVSTWSCLEIRIQEEVKI